MQDQLGTQLSEGLTEFKIWDTYLLDAASINTNLIPNNPAPAETTDALWNDLNYGLNWWNNTNQWMNLRDPEGDILKQKKSLFWNWELMTYFGLNIT